MINLIYSGLLPKKFMGRISLFITLGKIKSLSMEEELTSSPNKSPYLAKTLENTSIKLSMMPEIQSKNSIIILIMFSKR